jgi:pimeloyl-ACP methyl ester carboxylesterase
MMFKTKAVVAGFIFLTVATFNIKAITADTDILPLDLENSFTSVERNTLANPLSGLSAQVAKFSVDGLTQYALLLQPEGDVPESGWPVIIFNHGFHPDPFKNGRRSIDGINDRPGDYYRQIPQALARQGFLVVAPDYRGHNDSEGAKFTLQDSSPHWYARDVLGVIAALDSTDRANMEHLFMLGHSMGGHVTLIVAAALGDRLQGSSIWSVSLPSAATNSVLESELILSSQLQLGRISGPMNIHHAKDDPTTVFEGSAAIVQQLEWLGKTTKLYQYLSENHLFTGDNLQRAIRRDVELFRRIMKLQNRPQD